MMGPDPNASKAQTAMIVGVASLAAAVLGIVLFWVSCACSTGRSGAQAMGVMAIISGVLSLAALVVGIISIVMAVKYKKLSGNVTTPNTGKATAGMICGIVAVILSALSILSCASCVGCAACAACAAGNTISSFSSSDLADILDSADSLYY